MISSSLFLLIIILSFCKGDETLDCSNKASAKTTMMKLKLDLLCGYDKYLRPVPNEENTTKVELIIAPRIISFEDSTDTFTVYTWLSMNWKDYHLKWDKLQYDNIKQIHLDTSMVWVPDLFVYNSKEDMSLEQTVDPVIITESGNVYAFLSPSLRGHCKPDWSNWPFDYHTCTLTLGSRRYVGSSVDFHFNNDRTGLMTRFLLPTKDWELVKTNTSRNESWLGPKNESGIFLVSLNYDFTLRRHASVYIASYIIPGVVIIIMSLGLLCIPPNQVERTAILCTLAIIQSLFLQYLAYKIPSNGDNTPYLVRFYRDSLALTGLLVIETLVTRSMSEWTSNPPYIHSVLRFVSGNKVMQFVFLNDLDPKSAARMMESGNEEGSTLVVGDENIQQWKLFTNIVNRAVFVLLVPTYILLSFSLLPLNFSMSVN